MPRAVPLDLYLAHPHLLTSFNGELTGFIDERLAEMGLSRRVQFSYAEAWRDLLGLAIAELPFEVPRLAVSLMWPAAADLDPGLAWLRGAAVELWGRD